MYMYRIIVGEKGNEQGHIIETSAATDDEALRALAAELAAYGGDGWGRIEYREAGADDTMWRRL